MEAAAPAGRFDRFYRAIPLASAFLWLVVLYGWQTRGHVTPWLFTDELKLTQISRSIEETGHAALHWFGLPGVGGQELPH